MNNRELATVIILGALALLGVGYPKTRSSLPTLLRALFAPKLIIPLLIYALVLSASVWAADRLSFWSPALLWDTVFWFAFSGTVWYFSLANAAREPCFFRRRIVEALGLAAFFEFFISLEPLSLPGELAIQTTLGCLALLTAFASSKPECRSAKRVTEWLTFLTVAGLAIYTVVRLVDDWQHVSLKLLLEQLALPVWLTILSAPCIYLVALGSGYESLFSRLQFLNDRRPPPLKARLGIVAGLGGDLSDIADFRGQPARAAAQTGSFRVARRAVAEFRRDRRADRDNREAARARLEEYAGVDGVDEVGRRLDRREFAATKEALRWLATCHVGWFRRSGRYRKDLLTALQDFERQGLPTEHGVKSRVRSDGQAWYAYRQTAPGWWFGIGASGPPPNQWLFDGPQPPHTFPQNGSAWVNDLSQPTPPNWLPEPKT